jgi:hypothetical protein
MKTFRIILFLLLAQPLSKVSAQEFQRIILTEDAKVSMLTCSPGDELYSIFGHSAIRVKDPNLSLDVVFNYGTFDFATPNFYMKFIKGKLNYILSVSSFSNFLYEYMLEDRWVIEQLLDIDQEQKQFLLDSLSINYLPENREYLYDFFFDNCATRIRDIFYESLDDMEFDYSEALTDKSFRDLVANYTDPLPWPQLGINIALGSLTDRTATPWETMFLPDHMMDIFRYARIEKDSVSTLLCYPEAVLLEGKERGKAGLSLHHPMVIFWAIFLLGLFITYMDLRRKKPSRWFDTILFGFSGFLGIFLLFLWFGTEHTVLGRNFNLLWAIPFHFPVIFFLYRKKSQNFIRKYFFITSVILLFTVVFWRILPQEIPFALLPFILLMMIRSLLLSRDKRAEKKK